MRVEIESQMWPQNDGSRVALVDRIFSGSEKYSNLLKKKSLLNFDTERALQFDFGENSAKKRPKSEFQIF